MLQQNITELLLLFLINIYVYVLFSHVSNFGRHKACDDLYIFYW